MRPKKARAFFTCIVLAGLAGCLVFALLSDFGRRTSDDTTRWQAAEYIVTALGLSIDQISLKGHVFTSDTSLFDALELTANSSLLGFNSEKALQRLRNLPWVATATIERVYPSQLEVRVSEREPYALWRNGSALSLIDSTGRVLSSADPRTAPSLPLVEGKGAARDVGPLMRLVASSPLVSQRLVRAVRVSQRRWTLNLTNGVSIDLPAQGASAALANIRSHPVLRKLATRPNTVIDLRVNGRVFVRPTEGNENPVAITVPFRTNRAGRAG